MGSACCISVNQRKNSKKKKGEGVTNANVNGGNIATSAININNPNQVPLHNNNNNNGQRESNQINDDMLTFPNHNSTNRFPYNNNSISESQSQSQIVHHPIPYLHPFPNQNEDNMCNVSINNELDSYYNESSNDNPYQDYVSNNLDSSRTNHFCNRCNSNFVTMSQYNHHIPFCLQSQHDNSNVNPNINQNIYQMHNSLNQILNLVHSLHTQINNTNLMGYGECEEANEYFDWEYHQSSNEVSEIIPLPGQWRNKGKIVLTKNDLKAIETKTIDMMRNEKYYIKRIWLLKYINMNIYDKSNDNTPLVISRDNILEESFNQFMTTNELDLKRGMHIFFVDEVAQDVGGVYREWYNCLFKEIFSKKHNFFYENMNNSLGKNTYFISHTKPLIKNNYDQLAYYEFIGKVIAKALFDKITLNVNFNMILIKHLLKKPITLTDLAYYDKDIFQSLHSIQGKEMGKDSDLPFTWNIRNENNDLIDHELIPNGRNVYVNDSNKQDFISSVLRLLSYDLIKEKLHALLKGFDSLICGDILSIFKPEELDFILSGQAIIDLDDWRRNTVYKGYYSEKHWVIKMFWEIMKELKSEELAVFFKFCTGCSRVPIDGFSSLQSTRNKLLKFTIESPLRKDNDEPIGKKKNVIRLIEAKTCFNRITLPEYESRDQMKKAIYIIINNDTNFFGLQ